MRVIVIPPGFWKRRDEILPRGEAFMKGIRLYDYPGIQFEFWANTSNCFHGLTNFTWVDVPEYIDFVSLYGPTPWEKWQKTTLVFSQELALRLWICNSMNKNIYMYVDHRIDVFGSFLNYSYSFLQNILGKILSINNIYFSLIRANNRGDEIYMWFDFGRLIRVLMIFDAIELEDPEEDWYFNAQTAYFNAD